MTGKRPGLLVTVGVLLAALAGCGKGDQSNTTAPASPPPATTVTQTAPAAAPTSSPDSAADAAAPPQSALATFRAAGLPDSLIEYGCYSCHDVDGARIGPPLRAMAGLYRSNPQAVDVLTQKVLHGGGGVWGPTPMIAHPHLTAEQVQPMIEAILRLD